MRRRRRAVEPAGDSAGGNLAAATAHAIGRNGGLGIVGQVLIYPGLGGNPDAGSYLTHAKAPMLTRDDVLFYADTGSDQMKVEAFGVKLLVSDLLDIPGHYQQGLGNFWIALSAGQVVGTIGLLDIRRGGL